jgi:hypothetical protein
MDVACIANKDSAPHAELVGNTMVNAIAREPIDRPHVDIKKPLDLGADVFKAEFFAMRQFGRYQADQALHSA